MISGGRVLLACRDIKSCERAREYITSETYNKNVHCRYLDLASLDSVRKFTDEINRGEV